MIEYRTITSFRSDLVDQAARLHSDALSYRSFITLFGEPFLRQLYQALLDDGRAFLVCAAEGETLVGFVLAAEDASGIMRAVLRRWSRFGRIMLPALARRPRLLGKVLQTFLYARKSGTSVPAELIIIAVDKGRRSAGVGARLVAELDREFRGRGVRAYKATVHREMAASNRFYLRNGLVLDRAFTMYGVVWNTYVKTLSA
jgi:ribosomal protein S18 acetylase RimI-like enzyme